MSASLHHALLAFNFYPSQSLHPSWWSQLKLAPGLMPEQLMALNVQQPYLVSSWLLKQENIDGQFDFDFPSPDKQLLLQSPPELQTLLNYLTALLYHPFIASLLAAKKVKVIKHILGDDSYHFAVKKAPLLLKQPPAILNSSMVTAEALDFDNLTILSQQLYQPGIALLASISGNYAPAVRQRLLWKLPFEHSAYYAAFIKLHEQDDIGSEHHNSGQQLLKKLYKQLPQASF